MGEYFRRLLAFSDHSWTAHLVPNWGVLQVLAMLAAVLLLAWRTRGEERSLLLALAAGFFGAAIGTAALGAIALLPVVVREGLTPESIKKGGIVAYGALIGLVATYAFVAHRQKHAIARALDLLAPALGALVFFARIGCFIGGCDYGKVTTAPWAVRFPSGSLAFKKHVSDGLILASDRSSLLVHPTQLYEAGLGLVMLAVALVLGRLRPRAGISFAATAATYAVGRWTLELYRGDVRHYGVMSFSQWIGVALLIGLGMWLFRVRSDQGAAATTSDPGSASV